jgi:single-strand DNA-binding protein
MANLNKVMLIGRLTRDPEVRTFANGGKVANIGFAVNNRKKNPTTGEWENEPVWLDVKAFNRETGRKLADQAEQYMRKGHQFYIEGHLQLEQWTTQDGQKQSKLKIIMEDFQFLEPRQDGEGGSRFQRSGAPVGARAAAASRPVGGGYDEPAPEPEPMEPRDAAGEDPIPF